MNWVVAAVGFWVGSVGLLQADAIDDLERNLNNNGGIWQNGFWQDIRLPQTASPEELLKAGTEKSYLKYFSSVAMISQRTIEIKDSIPEKYTAVLFSSNRGNQIMLMYFAGTKKEGLWASRVYTVNKGR